MQVIADKFNTLEYRQRPDSHCAGTIFNNRNLQDRICKIKMKRRAVNPQAASHCLPQVLPLLKRVIETDRRAI